MTRRKFSREFKIEAVRLVTDRGVAVAQACRDLDVAESVLRRWMRELTAAPAAAFPRNGQMRADLAEIAALKKEVARLRAERDIRMPPVRAVCRPIRRHSKLWRPYMLRHRQNLPWRYHNGGIWPMIGGFWVLALCASGAARPAARALIDLARANALDDWRFNEWLDGRTLEPRGMPRQSWNAAAFLMAHAAVTAGARPFDVDGFIRSPGRSGRPKRR